MYLLLTILQNEAFVIHIFQHLNTIIHFSVQTPPLMIFYIASSILVEYRIWMNATYLEWINPDSQRISLQYLLIIQRVYRFTDKKWFTHLHREL